MTEEVTGSRFVAIPIWLYETDVSCRALALYGLLQSYISGRSGVAYPSRPTLAKRLGCSIASLDRAKRELVDVGAVQVEVGLRDNGSQTSNRYKLRSDLPFEDESPVVTGDDPPSSQVSSPLITGEDGPRHRRPPQSKTHSTRPKELDPKNKQQPSATAVKLANLLADLLAERLTKRPVVSDEWELTIDRMIRLDGVDPKQVEGAIRWSLQDEFWHRIILSPKNLRKHYERLRLDAQVAKKKPGQTISYIQEQLQKEQANGTH